MLTALEELVLDIACEKRYVVAEKALPLVQALAEQKRVVAEELIGAEERAEAFEEHRALMALASALQGEEVEKR